MVLYMTLARGLKTSSLPYFALTLGGLPTVRHPDLTLYFAAIIKWCKKIKILHFG